MARVVLDAVAVAELAHHLEVVACALFQPLRFHQFVSRPQLHQTLLEFHGDEVDRGEQRLSRRDVVCLRVDGDTGQRTQNGAGERIEHGDLLDRVVEQLDAQRLLVGFRGEHIDDVATHPVGTAMEVDVVAGVLQLGQPPEEMTLIEQVAAIQMQHHLQVRAGISEAIDRRDGRNHDDIAALEQCLGG